MMGYYKTNRDFREARWDEPIIMKLGNPGERGILVPKAVKKLQKQQDRKNAASKKSDSKKST